MSTPYGRYRFLRMPFGISSAPEIFQAAMHRLLDGLPSVAVVMDDILVWGKTKDEHDCNLTLVLTRCREHNLRLNLKKCTFLQAEVRYLGHILTTQGLRIDPERVQDILEIPEPKTKTAWPEHKHGVPEPGRPYWTYREEVHAQDGLVFRSNKGPSSEVSCAEAHGAADPDPPAGTNNSPGARGHTQQGGPRPSPDDPAPAKDPLRPQRQEPFPADSGTTRNDVRHSPENLGSSYCSKASRNAKIYDCEDRRRP
nr:uncharacterized protein LOC129388145 isoform X2 [Dermacentor andersoni]